jgi:ATP-binding cassette subfamily F protein uup
MAPPVLALRGVRLADGPRWLFDGVDLALETRDRACLVGRNGAGKSTLLRILAGLGKPDEGERTLPPGTRITLVAQEPALVGATLRDFAMGGGAAAHEADAALETFGLDPERAPIGLSGGEARRAALAKAFAEQPDILLLDEPTNHLDILAIDQLEALIGRSRSAILTVSHDRAFLERTTKKCFWLEGATVRRLDAGFGKFEPWAAAQEAAESEEARRLDKMLEREQHWMLRGVTARRARNEGRRRRLIALRAAKSESLRLARGEMTLTASSAAPSGKRVAEAKGLTKAYGDRTLIEGFSTRILRGDRVAIVGPNGAGKTTLVKLLLGDIAPDAGSVKLGTNLEIVYVDQARAELTEGMTLWSALAPGGGDQVMVAGQPRHVAAYAKDFLFRDDQLRQPVTSLSGGERNRLLLARALAKPANVLVLDEPTNDLDMETLDLLEDMLADFEGALILVSHDRDFIDRLATSTIALDGRGHVVETPGGWADFLEQNPGFLETPGAPPTRVSKAAKASAPVKATPAPAKLSFKDQHRLKELETQMPRFSEAIAREEAHLADPDLYTRHPARFDAALKTLDRLRADLARAEEEWLALEARREALTLGAGAGRP